MESPDVTSVKKIVSSPSRLINSAEENMLDNDDNNTEYNECNNEINVLKEQINKLQEQIYSMQNVLDMKEKALVNIYKEKEKILVDLKRHKRSNLNLKQQLEDEREHFLKEKEYYCKEMTESYKCRPKKGIARNEEYAALPIYNDHKIENENIKNELFKTKKQLNETLEANYNLSIKYLRIKNTNYSLKSRFKRTQTEASKVMLNFTQKLDETREEINYIINDKFRSPITPSNKKYLQVVKQNTQLIHENLTLQIEISKLYNEIERIKADKIRYETKTKLKYITKIKKNYLDRSIQVNMDEEMRICSKECRNLIFREKDIDISEKTSNSSIFSNYSLNRYDKHTQSTPDFIKRDDSIIKIDTYK